ncbi:MAG TPA: alpha-ketoglutarate-dependent dioxygenase AlkB [Pyrinomonadaceae bacterium]|nr:alpha-ketoglutarate-dependent dioxygenase AlkB [Pyrinomonadaceae bacterium]
MKSERKDQLFLGFEAEQDLAEYPKADSVLMPDADVVLFRDFFEKEESDLLFVELLNKIEWKQDRIKYYGKEMDLPRLTAWYGDSGASYTYSNISMNSTVWTPTLMCIKEKIEKMTGASFNSVLLNYYRHGRDSVSWHRDNEPELGKNPVIASVSFGETRRFQFKHIKRKELGRVDVELTHGSLLVMQGTTQEFWLHQIPKTSKPIKPRVNLTFRRILEKV